jgi:hypothetical protein
MRLSIEGTTVTGAVLDLRERRVDPDALLAALRDEPSPYDLECPSPGPVHERVGVVTEATSVRRRTALALAARSRGLSAPQDDRIEHLRGELAAVEVPAPPTTPDAPPAEDVTRLRERVASLRGAVKALEAIDHDPADARERLREAAGRLAELETERAASEQADERLRAVRDARERRLRLEDRLANAERAARAHLADLLSPAVADAVAALGACDDEWVDEPTDAPADALALAVLRLARVEAPVLLRVDRLGNPGSAAAWLGAPVIRL